MNENKDMMTRKETLPEKKSQIPVTAPIVDIYENDDEILLYADMPGVAREDISVNVDNGVLLITGMRKLINTNGAANWQEFGDVEYRRTFSVPQAIDVGKVVAELKIGVLKLHLPKSEAAKPRQIKIH